MFSQGFYAGLGPAVVGITPYIGLNFAIYETLQKISKDFINRKDDNASNKEGKLISLLRTGLIGGIAGGASKFLVYPLVSTFSYAILK